MKPHLLSLAVNAALPFRTRVWWVWRTWPRWGRQLPCPAPSLPPPSPLRTYTSRNPCLRRSPAKNVPWNFHVVTNRYSRRTISPVIITSSGICSKSSADPSLSQSSNTPMLLHLEKFLIVRSLHNSSWPLNPSTVFYFSVVFTYLGRVPTFLDWQNSLTFPVFFLPFSSIFLMFCFLTENLIHFSKSCTVHLNITKNIK